MTYVHDAVELIWQWNLVMQHNLIVQILVCRIVFFYYFWFAVMKNNSSSKSYLSGSKPLVLTHNMSDSLRFRLIHQDNKPNQTEDKV